MMPSKSRGWIVSALCFIVLLAEHINVVQGYPKKKKGSMSEANVIVESFERTVRPPNDKRSYRGLKLSNEMNVILINDPSAEMSAACLEVGVGAINDFPDVPGLANLVGYMLLHGSRKYSGIAEYIKFLHNCGGRSHLPTTRIDHQLFSFEVSSRRLDDALNAFAQLFVDPLLPDTPQPEALRSSLRCVQDDYEEKVRRMDDDEHRIAEVEKLTCKKNSMYNHFFIGNANTLLQHVRNYSILKLTSLAKKVSRFHEIWYSSNIMNLVVLGRDSLDRLEAMVAPRFAKVGNKNKTRFTFPDGYYPWGPEEMRNEIYIVPRTDMRSLRLTFSFPDNSNRYKVTPQKYINYFFAQEGEGSLSFALQRRGYCNQLSSEFSSAAGITFCVIKCDITDYGLEYGIDGIVHLVFQYLHLLKTKGVNETLHTEIRKANKLNFFSYAPTESLSSFVQSLATLMQAFPTKDVLAYQYSDDQWDPSAILEVLGYLRPDNMNLTIVSRSLVHIAKQEEKYFGTKYAIDKIADETIEDWSNIKTVIPELRLPQCNEFLTDDFDIYPRGEKEPKFPYVIHRSSKLEIWFKQDDVFLVPRLQIILELHSSMALNEPLGYALWHIYETALAIELQKKLHSAVTAHLEWKIKFNDYGIIVREKFVPF